SVNNLSLTRLEAPSLSVKKGVISWEDQQGNASAFKILTRGESTDEQLISKNVSGKYSYSLSGVVAGAYSVEMYAIGDSQNLIYESGKHYLNSAPRQIDNIVKLEKKELTFDKANKLIKVVDFEASKGLMLTLNITTPTGSQSVNISTGELSFNFTSVGAYQFSLVNTAKTDRELNSDVGDVLTVVKLDQAKNVTHKVVNGVYTLENYQVENATNYALEIWKDSAKVAEVTNSNNQVDDLFTSAGAYSVKVVASGTDANKTYYLPSETLTDVTAIRLADLELVNNQVAKEITWQSVGTYNNLLYSYVLTGAYAEEGTKETSSFSYAGLGVGSYRLNVYAKITANEGQKTLILDSLNKNTFIDFKIEKTIQAPSLAFRTDDLNGYLVDITNVEGADQLNIMCNEGLIATIPTQEGSITTYNITNTLKGVGTGVKSNLFKIEVSAGNSNNEFYKESAKAELNFERLEDVLLTNDTVNKKIIWNNIGNGVIYKYQIAGAGTLNGSLTSTEFSYANIDVVGNYTFTAWATASQQNGQTIIIDSLNKTTTEFKVEKAIAAPNVTFKNDETNGYVLEIANVEGANQYSISCNNNLLEVVGRQSGDKTIYNVNDVLKGSGVGDNANLFNIKVSASSSENEFYKESLETSLNFERLADVQLVNNVESKKITWQSISQTIENIVYKYETTGMAALNGELSTNEFNYAGLTNVGDYTLSVWATVSRQSGDVIILDSLNKSTITFKVVTTLDAPELTFTKDTSAGTKYLLNISNVNNATQYDVYLNGTLSKQLTALGGEETNFDITSIFNLSGAGNNNDTYTFGVVAKNIAAGDYYMPSNNTELIVVKAAAPQNFNLQVMQMGKTITENITSNFYAGWLESTEITINGTAGTTITGINECTVQIKYIANDNKVANKYYIDSSYSEFIIKRITSNVYLNGSMVTWDANETEALNNQNFKVKLMLELNGEVFNVIDVTNNAGTGYDLSKLNIDLNLLKDSNAKISICYVAENLNNATASGEYYASSALNSFNISTANQLGLDIVEENEKVKFVLNNKKDGATYKLNGNITAELNSGDFETSITELLGIEEVYQSERALYLFTVTRVGNINSLSINEDESIMLPTNYPVGAGELVISGISKDENGNYSLKPIDASSETNINAYFKAQESDGQAYNYYLDGTPSTFTFKRLSALNVATNLNVSNDIVSWNKEEANLTNSYTYKVIFSSTNTEDVQKILPLSDTVSMNLNSSEYLSIIYALSGVEKYITIQKLVQGFTVNSGSVGYLTSQSSRYDLKILNAPT
ncbi:MAG: hypothetical protein IJW25_02270, partial [Clostridia bacterium]|nr:hypothetical protein [Clostridia bacterium]